MSDLSGWLGVACLLLAGAGWGAQVSREGVTGPALAGVIVLSILGLTLTARAFLAGFDLPLVLGAVGALATATLMIFNRRG